MMGVSKMPLDLIRPLTHQENSVDGMKNHGLLKTAVAFGISLVLVAGLLGYLFTAREKSLESQGMAVRHSYNVIQQAKDIAALTEGMLASQRGFIMTGKEEFLVDYEAKKAAALEQQARLVSLTRDNGAQTLRFEEMKREFDLFTALLEKRAEKYKAPPPTPEFIEGVEDINNARQTILSINASVLDGEYAVLSRRLEQQERRRQEYYLTVMVGSILGVTGLLLLNGVAVYMAMRRLRAEQSLRESEDRFALAVEGANDGIFDWDLRTGKVFYSRAFFAMLGNDRGAFTGTLEDFREPVHPEDRVRVFQYIDRYLAREVSDYSSTFRMRNADGNYLWINSRGKAVFDPDGKAVRMVGANSDVTFLKEYQERLKEEKARAEAGSRAKSDFLAHMSHEIRTPLTAINGIAEILTRNNKNLDDKQKQLVRALGASTETLKDLVNDILDFSRIESGDLQLEDEVFRLGSVSQQVISIMALNATEKGIGFAFADEDVRFADFRGDALRLRQILINLVGNAIKFTEKGGVTIEATRVEQEGAPYLSIKVQDTGVGISPENQELIFDRFKQVDSSISRRYGGSGLGLSICRNLAQLMGGTLTVQSELGQGATFTLMLPWKAPVTAADAVDEALELKKTNRAKALLSGESRVLLAEDYEGNVVVVSYMLGEMGCTCDVARNGAEALELWQKNHYDLILMDVQMPKMDGFATTTAIRALEVERHVPRTPIIGMTAHALIGDQPKCIEAGMDAYLPKPIVEADFRAEVLHYLNSAKRGAA